MNEPSLRVLIIDDEPQIRRLLRTTLKPNGYTIIEASTGEEGLVRAGMEHPDLVLLDLGLPDIDGMEVLRRLREWSRVPVIVLSVRGGERDKIQALDSGADDYLAKPFGIGELMARMRAALRHALQGEKDEPLFESGGLVVDMARRLVRTDGREVRLTPKEYDLLHVLVANAGKVVTHGYLLREVWGPAYTGQTHYLRVYIGTLRGKIEQDPARPRHIITEPGVGYRLIDHRP